MTQLRLELSLKLLNKSQDTRKRGIYQERIIGIVNGALGSERQFAAKSVALP
jgi:hypothetical protein